MKNVLLNCLPPVDPLRPGYSLSVIKPFLIQNGYKASVKYWNLSLRNVINDFWLNQIDSIPLSQIFKDLMPFYNYYAIDRKDQNVFDRIKILISKYFPNKAIGSHLENNAILLKNSIKKELKDMNIENFDYVYVQSKFYKYELISAGVFCEILKESYPEVITIIEAQEFERKAMALMDSFDCYDFATWGEYELPLLGLLNSLVSNGNLSLTPNIIYRQNGMPVSSLKRINHFIDINSTPIADFSDYIEQTYVDIEEVRFPLESGRGCHWNGCSFCFMNDGYKHRVKKVERIKYEVREYIKQYNAQLFYYIDNDVVGNDIKRFDEILEFYKDIRKTNKFAITLAEIIAKDINADIVLKMRDAGIRKIQIGYESTSDKMLKLMNKKSHFSHLLLICKWCFAYDMLMYPQNILRSMPFETDVLILENIQNLFYLRFLLKYDSFYHSLRELCVMSTSRDYKTLTDSNRIQDWDYTPMQEFMPASLLKPEYTYDVFLIQTRKYNPLWELFAETETYYKTHKFDYSLSMNDNGAEYTEYTNNVACNQIQLSLDDIKILYNCDRNVVNFNNIYNELADSYTKEELFKRLKQLNELGLIYMSDIYDEIVSTVIVSDKYANK